MTDLTPDKSISKYVYVYNLQFIHLIAVFLILMPYVINLFFSYILYNSKKRVSISRHSLSDLLF